MVSDDPAVAFQVQKLVNELEEAKAAADAANKDVERLQDKLTAGEKSRAKIKAVSAKVGQFQEEITAAK